MCETIVSEKGGGVATISLNRPRVLNAFSDLPTALEAEAEGQTLCGYTQDHKEGITALFEKREANFTGS